LGIFGGAAGENEEVVYTGWVGQDGDHKGTTRITSARWIDIASTYDNVNAKIYLEGLLDGTTAETQSPTSGNHITMIGGTDRVAGGGVADSQFFTGLIAFVAVWRRVLSAGEIFQLHRDPRSMFQLKKYVFGIPVLDVFPDTWYPKTEQPYPDVNEVVNY
jgi:hypothetical protein